MNSIFMIITFNDDRFHSRCVGYYHRLKHAETCVKINNGNIYEDGYYPYAVIEEVEPGLYPFTKNRWFYKWDDGYKSCESPDENIPMFAPIG